MYKSSRVRSQKEAENERGGRWKGVYESSREARPSQSGEGGRVSARCLERAEAHRGEAGAGMCTQVSGTGLRFHSSSSYSSRFTLVASYMVPLNSDL